MRPTGRASPEVQRIYHRGLGLPWIACILIYCALAERQVKSTVAFPEGGRSWTRPVCALSVVANAGRKNPASNVPNSLASGAVTRASLGRPLHAYPEDQREIEPNGGTILLEVEPPSAKREIATVSDFGPPPQSAPKIDWNRARVLGLSILVGMLSGLNISAFKLAIDFIRDLSYGSEFAEHFPVFCIPVLGGLGVGALLLMGGDFPPGLRGVTREVDSDVVSFCAVNNDEEDRGNTFSMAQRFSRKSFAAVVTLGTGNSLGPEGPAVEAGMSVSRLCMSATGYPFAASKGEISDVVSRVERSRLLLACGAAAGVSAGFNAPLSGVFFALEIVQKSLPTSIGVSSKDENSKICVEAEPLGSESINISAILLASVTSALISELVLGKELALRISSYEFVSPLAELPLYLLLGVLSGLVAALFSGLAQQSKAIFEGTKGPKPVQEVFQNMPLWLKPSLGGLTCGLIGTMFPQVLFFGYETLNSLLSSTDIPTAELFMLLGIKAFSTAVAAASGLVGGTFAPSLFLGGMLGAGFHNVVLDLLQSAQQSIPAWKELEQPILMSGVPAYAMVGAASVLAALFRAPLTASLLLFECTRDYDVILPLMASAGVASLIGDVVEEALEEQKRELDAVSWGDLASIGTTQDDEVCRVEWDDR
uniref:Chloride channel protein n=1 Tax=Trieres chinensis TaxID=1514140 RepID=A0A7S2EG16_TRICV|mmetsp:Transcript_21349/g.43074  ORF Transcript_21349/g.43074 Transcript_21349/m.43074 type:complete len:652 (+) Transcript_21349:134-2089(+)|eukprot:CAMPEP_0183293576 /NCGR_PEP_ID=MMETSP0160_2-20130417/2208_1 /TAXON_ID=2839 ORGANISM="Odontella Sinensis, Strain Grunow 1884" /NCGR_SAMPLE_ID=MMETSP0160_2 /ASSEMBLY_ACC=CAM_ASM_000250 /LENGTH=651 /DNA_ID=CAMNT_0025454715 /DNA_START=72 /DNA_END=2027 /DNA_ORIENTATION=+